MENGAESLEESVPVPGGGALQPVSVGSVAGDSPNEVFEEMMDTPKESFYTPHHRDLRDFMFRREVLEEDSVEPRAAAELEKLDESIEEQIAYESHGEEMPVASGSTDEPANALFDGSGPEEREAVVSEKFEDSIDAPENPQNFQEQEAVSLGEEAEGKVDGVIQRQIHDVVGGSSDYADSVGDVNKDSSAPSDAEGNESVGGRSANGLNLDESHLSANKLHENGECDGIESKEETPCDNGSLQVQDASVGLDFFPDEEVKELQSKNIHSMQDNAVTDKGSSAPSDGEGNESVGGRSANAMNLDESHPGANKLHENGECDGIEPKEETPCDDGSLQVQDASVGFDFSPEEELKELQSKYIHSMQDNSVTDKGSSAPSDGEENESVGGWSANGVNLDESHPGANKLHENGECRSIESKEETPCDDGSPQLKDASVGLDFSPDEEVKELQSKDIHSMQDNALTDNGIQTENHTTPVMQYGGEIPGSDKNPETGKCFEKESILLEDLGDSSSTDDDDSRTPSQSAPSADSRQLTSGATVLPSRPTGLVSSAPAGNCSLPSHPAGVGSSSPTGVPSLPSRPAGLGSSSPLLEHAPRSLQQPRANGSVLHRQSQPSEELANDDTEENDETREKLQMIRVKFLRLAHRLGQTTHNTVVAQVLYRLGLAEQLRKNTNRPGVFSYDRASVMAEQLEAAGQEPLDFSCTIMVIGKTGVGKSATINSIFDEFMFQTNAFQFSTQKVQEIVGMVQGIKVRVIDTPGLFTSTFDQRRNEKILRSVKRFITKTPPDIVLYLDRLDMHSRDYGDVPLLRTITDIFGSSIWFNAIVVLTHAACAPPDGPNGTPLTYETFVSQRSHVVQQAIRQAAGDVRLMNPISLVENHSACRINRAGQRVLPNGQVWKPQLLLLSFASKILAEANMLLKLQDGPPGMRFGSRTRVPPLPFLLTSLLQSTPELKLPEEQFGDDDALNEDLDESSDSDLDFDELPPFRSLSKVQLEKLSKAQKKAYFEELDYREKLMFRKQLKEEKKRRKLMKKMAEAAKDLPNDYTNESMEDENSGPASVPVPLPDYTLPASFDSDSPSHRYRFLDSSSQWLVRPVLDSQGWDHDVGYEGLNIERLFVFKEKMPLSVSGQLTKDKKDFNLQMEVASSIKHGEGNATSLNMDMQTIGKDMAYTLRGETRIKNFRRNKTAVGLSFAALGDSVSAGMKIEDKLMITKSFRLLMSGGAMTGRGDVAYGGRLEATLRDKDYPVGRMLSTLALSVVDWHGDLALGCNFQSQLPLGRGGNLIAHVNLSNKGSGQVGLRLNSSEHLQIALLALVPIFRNVKRILSDYSQSI